MLGLPFFMAATNLSAQTTQLYTENFSYADGTETSTQWTLDVSHCNLAGSNSHFQVLAQKMEGRNLGGEAVWYSNVITISGYQHADISMDLSRTGTMTSADYIKVFYKLNGGAEVLLATNGSQQGSFTPVTASQTGLTGNTLQLVVRVYNSSASRKHYFDNVVVNGVTPLFLPLSAVATSLPATCTNHADGSATVVATGGTPPYQYLWSNGATQATAALVNTGTYQVTVTDAVGTTMATSTVVGLLNPTQVNVEVRDASPGRSDGFAKLSLSGGHPPYTVSWASGGNATSVYHLPAGTYPITVTDSNQCVVESSAVIGTSDYTTLLYQDFDGLFSSQWNSISFEGNMVNHWVVSSTPCSIENYSMQIANSTTACSYSHTRTQDIISYIPIDATSFDSLVLRFNWHCMGENNYDYGSVWYSVDAVNWQRVLTGGSGSGWYSNNMFPSTETIALPDSLKNRAFYIGFNWNNDNNLGTDPGFVIDDVSLVGKPYAPITPTPTVRATCHWLGTQNIYWSNAANWDCGHVPTAAENVVINANTPHIANVMKPDTGYCYHLTLEPTAQMDVTAGAVLRIAGNVDAPTPMVINGGLVELVGDSVQHIGMADSSKFYDLTIRNNTDSGVVLQTNVSVANILSLNKGNVVTGNDTLIMLDPYPVGLGIVSYSDSSHIVGNLRRNIYPKFFSYVFPMGKMGNNSMFEASITPINVMGVDYLTASFGNLTNSIDSNIVATDSGMTYLHACNEGMWTIEPNQLPSTCNYDVTLGTSHLQHLLDNQFGVLKRPVGSNASQWSNGGGTLPASGAAGRNVADGFARRTGLHDFSDFCVATTNIMVSSQAYFTGRYRSIDNAVEIDLNDTAFANRETHLQRSLDGVDFMDVGDGFIPQGDGFAVLDANPSMGLAFYRLVATDDGGNRIESKTISVKSVAYADDQVVVFPNPTHGQVHVRMNTQAASVNMVVTDMNGNVVYTYSGLVDSPNFHQSFDLSGKVAMGEYLLRISTPSETFIRRISVVR